MARASLARASLRDGGGLRNSARGSSLRAGEEFDPMASVANVVDVMLVLAVALTIAISTYWHFNISDMQQVLMEDEITEVDDVEAITAEIAEGGDVYNELGTVYEDAATGKMYMLTEDVEDSEVEDAEASGK